MITWGINALNHDASIAVIKDRDLVFWGRSADYTEIRGDDKLCSPLIRDALNASSSYGPSNIVWYERPLIKKTRQFRAGQYKWAFDINEMPKVYLKQFRLTYPKFHYVPHHLSHAAAGFLTSPFNEATVVVLDAIGEWESATIWYASGTDFKKLWSRSYPTSLGIFYSAFTDLIGYKPLGEEHLLQKLSDHGNPMTFYKEVKSYWSDSWRLKENLHKGVRSWPHGYDLSDQDKADIAAATQKVFEEQADYVMSMAKKLSPSKNLVYMGGCAMNSKYNKKLVDQWQGVWSLPIPGDSASSIGAALYHEKLKIKWKKDLPKHIEVKYGR